MTTANGRRESSPSLELAMSNASTGQPLAIWLTNTLRLQGTSEC
jgi:hypothetical protein